jgi:hypothetical protein
MPSLFKTLGVVLCLAFALCFAAPNAHADSFTPVFNTVGCTGTCHLPTAPDVTFPAPTTMKVTFDGRNWVEAILAGQLPGDSYTWFAHASGADLTFALVESPATSCSGFSIVDLFSLSCGQLTFAPVATATPEPSSLALMLSGVGLVFAMRKRWTAGLQRAS